MRLLPLLLLCAFKGSAQTTVPELIDEGHFKRARAAAEARLKEAPNDAEALCQLSRVRQIWGNLDEAHKLAERAASLAPKEARYHFQLAQTAGEKAEKASLIHQMGLGRQFKREVDLTLQLDPRHVEAMKDLMIFYVEAPGVMGGDKAKAHGMVDRIAKVDPVEGYLAQIQLAQRLKEQVAVEELLRKAVAANPESYTARMNLGSYLANQKKFAEGEREAREAIRLKPGRAAGFGLLAAVLVHQDKWAELDAALAQAEKASPDDLLAYYRAANNALARKVELPRAERYFRKYLSMEPEAHSPGLAVAHWRLGLVLEGLGRKAEAIKEVETGVKLDANLAPAKADLKRLKG
jgi:Tfp pilus assembly protein PilF